jgi:hypothetical protein
MALHAVNRRRHEDRDRHSGRDDSTPFDSLRLPFDVGKTPVTTTFASHCAAAARASAMARMRLLHVPPGGYPTTGRQFAEEDDDQRCRLFALLIVCSGSAAGSYEAAPAPPAGTRS